MFRGDPCRFRLFGGKALCLQPRRFLGGEALGFGLLGDPAFRFHALGLQALGFLAGNALGFEALGFVCRLALGLGGADERQARLGQRIAQCNHRGDQRRIHRHLRRRCLQGMGGRAHRVGNLADHGDTAGIGRLTGGQQALDVALRRRRERRHRRHFGHRESAVESVDCAQKAVVDGAVAGTRLRQPGIDGFQVAADFGAKDVQQHRIDLHRNRLGGGRFDQRCFGFGFDRGRTGVRRGRGHDCAQQHVLAGREAVGNAFHRRQVHADRGLAAQRGMQVRQHIAGLADEGDHRLAGRPRTVQHAVEHVLDVPAELAEGLGTDQPATALQGVEHAADRAQQFGVVGRAPPRREQFIEVADFFLEFLQEDLADFVVDLVAGAVETGAERRGTHLLGNHVRCNRRGVLGGLDRSGGGGSFDPGFNGLGFGNRLIDRVCIPQRPVAEQLEAAAGLFEQVLTLAMRLAQGFQVVLHAGQCIGQGVQLAAVRDLQLADQFCMAVAPQCLEVAGRLGQLQHPHRAADLTQQARHRIQRGVVPIGFDEGHERIAHFREVGDRFAREHRDHLARFLRQQVVACVVVALAQARDLVVQRMVDVDQRTGHVQQVGFVRGTLAAGDAVHDLALLLDQAAGGLQSDHAEGFADPVQRLRLRLQRGHVGEAGAQVQVQRVLDPQQVFLERRGHRVQQRPVAPGEAAARVLEFGLAGLLQQGRQCVLVERGFTAGRAQLVEQRQQHDRDVAMPALQALQVVRQLHHAAHQRRASLVAIAGGAALQRTRQVLHLLGHHRRRMQFQHAQGAKHLVQVAGAGAHALAVAGRLGEGLDLDPRLAQGLVDLGLHPAERGVVDGIPQRRGHRDAPVMPRNAGRALTVLFIRTSTSADQAGSLKSATERRRSAASWARIPTDSAVWLAPCEVCAVIDWMVFIVWVMPVAALDCCAAAVEMP